MGIPRIESAVQTTGFGTTDVIIPARTGYRPIITGAYWVENLDNDAEVETTAGNRRIILLQGGGSPMTFAVAGDKDEGLQINASAAGSGSINFGFSYYYEPAG